MTPNAAKKRKPTDEQETPGDASAAASPDSEKSAKRWAGKKWSGRAESTDPESLEPLDPAAASTSVEEEREELTGSAPSSAGQAGGFAADGLDPWDLAGDDETALEDLPAAASPDDPIAGAVAQVEALRTERAAAEAETQQLEAERFARYAEILRRSHSTEPGDREELAELVVQLGFDRARIERDAAIVRQARGLETKLASQTEVDAEAQAAREHYKQTQSALEDASHRVQKSDVRQSSMRQYQHQLCTLQRNNRELLRGRLQEADER